MAEKKFVGMAADFINAMKLNFIGKGADPNSIIVQDLYRYDSAQDKTTLTNNFLNNKKEMLFNQLSRENREILQALMHVYNDKITTKRDLLTQARRLYETDVVQTMIDVMIDDGFNSFANEKEEFKIEYDLDEDEKEALGEKFQEEVQNVFDEFIEKFSLKTKVAEIVPELLRDGEYAFGVLYDEENKKGVTEIVDDMDVIDLLPFYEGDKLSFVIKQDRYDDSTDNTSKGFKMVNNVNFNTTKIYKPDNIVFFRLKGPTKKRINMSLFYDQEFRKLFYEKTNIKLPKYIRIPLPIYYGAIKNLNRLQLMENVSTVLDLSEVLRPGIVTVSVPTNTTGPEAKQIIRDYERQLNDNSGLSNTEELDISTLATQANRIKVLPQWFDTKGQLTTTGIGTSNSPKSEGAWNTVSKLRDLIALSVGIPPFYINLAETPRDKHETIKLYSRYTRKLTSLQKSLADGIKDLLMLHCQKKGINISRENINIKFKAITSGDALEDTDMMVATITGINDLYKGVDEIASSDNNNFVIDDQQFKELFDNLTSKYLNISDIIRIDEHKFDEQEFGEEGFEPTGSPSGASADRMSAASDNIDRGFEELSGGEDTSYEAFTAAEPEVELEGTQEIETEA